jgi:hypothetical protein
VATTVDPGAIFQGAPFSIEYGGVECGAMIDNPKITITPTASTPKFTNAKGPIVGTTTVSYVECTVEFTVNELTLARLAMAMPGAQAVGDKITWAPGRVPTSAYKDLVIQQEGPDGKTFVFALYNALSVNPFTVELAPDKPNGIAMKFMGYAEGSAPGDAPFHIELDLGS